MEIESRENYNTMTWDYKITIWKFIFRRVLTREQVITENYPLWFRFSKWLFIVLCNHRWEYDRKINMFRMFEFRYKCKTCGLERDFPARNRPTK